MRIREKGLLQRDEFLFAILLYLMVFQHPLEQVGGVFSGIDELVGFVGLCLVFILVLAGRKITLTKSTLTAVIALMAFVLAGLLGNILFQYQPWRSVLIDLFTNLKFYLSILTGYFLFRNHSWKSLTDTAIRHGKIITLFLLVVFIADRIFNLYPAEIRHGIRSGVLFFVHPTHLAGAAVFLITLLTIFYDKTNIPYIAANVFFLASTMRSKAIAAAAVYIAMFFYFLVIKGRKKSNGKRRKPIKLRYIAVLGTAAILVALPQLRFYYVTLGGISTRSVITSLSFQIARDYFPIGTGFACYASSEAAKHFSPVYILYDLEYLLRFDPSWRSFLNDTFWPIIIGQTGVFGTIAYLVVVYLLFKKCLALYQFDPAVFVGVLFAFIYVLIASMAEPAFNNSVAVPLAVLMGMAFRNLKSTKIVDRN